MIAHDQDRRARSQLHQAPDLSVERGVVRPRARLPLVARDVTRVCRVHVRPSGVVQSVGPHLDHHHQRGLLLRPHRASHREVLLPHRVELLEDPP